MKISYVGTQSYQAVINHTQHITLKDEDAEAILVEDSRHDPVDARPCINTCSAVRALAEDERLAEEFKRLYNIKGGVSATYLYGFVGESDTTDFLEMTYSTKLMTGNVGPDVGFVKGTGMYAPDIFNAVPSLSNLIEGLQTMGYRGEICVGINDSYEINNVIFGLFMGGWALYNELSKGTMDDYYKFTVDGTRPKGLHKNGIAVVNLMTVPPFPSGLAHESFMTYPPEAEKHIYRTRYGRTEVAYASAWGTDITEAKRRCRLTLENCNAVNPDLQYRVDYGYKESFVLSADRWDHLGGVKPRT